MNHLIHELRDMGWRKATLYTAWALILAGLCWAGLLVAWAATLPEPPL